MTCPNDPSVWDCVSKSLFSRSAGDNRLGNMNETKIKNGRAIKDHAITFVRL